MNETKRTYCRLCHWKCGLLMTFQNGKAVSVKGDKDHPVTKGVVCERSRLMIEHLYHADRINHPMKRTGDRGSGQWQQISWDDALDEVAAKLSALGDKYGAETLAFTHGTDRTYHWDQRRFFNLFGSPNTCGAANICYCPTLAVEYATYGGETFGEIDQTKCIVVWGHGSSNSYTGYFQDVLRAKKNGATLIVIDPRRIREAELADLWLPVRPGTDVALMMGWLNVIINEKLYDQQFVEHWTVGFEDLRRVVSDYTPDRVAQITWLTPDLVIESARSYAGSESAIITWGLGIDKQGVNATQAARTRAILRAVTGNIDIPGGEVLGWNDPVGSIITPVELELNDAISAEQRAKQLGADEYPFFGFPGWEANEKANRKLPGEYMHPPRAGLTSLAHARSVFEAMTTHQPYPVRAAITVANNPLLSQPNVRKTYQALNSLDLYVVGELYLTPSAALADYVFPVCSTVETTELWHGQGFCVACPRGIEPLHERRNTYDFWRGLAIRLGQSEHWPWETIDEVWDHCLNPVGLTFEKLVEQNGVFGQQEYKRYEKFGFGTSSGKVELRSSIFADLGCEPLPVFREMLQGPLGDPELVKEYPLILISGSRFTPMYHSEHRQIPTARKKRPDPQIRLHPETAGKTGAEEGDWVKVFTPQGNIRTRLKITDIVDPRMADIDHGWWFPEREESKPDLFGVFESNANVLCPDSAELCSPETGSWPHTALLCRVEKEEV